MIRSAESPDREGKPSTGSAGSVICDCLLNLGSPGRAKAAGNTLVAVMQWMSTWLSCTMFRLGA